MRTALALPIGLAVGLAVGLAAMRARAEPTARVSLRLEYLRGPGGEACPSPEALREAVAQRLGYDPFERTAPGAPERLTVVVGRRGRGWAADVERYDAGGAQTWRETFPVRGDDCAALISPLASELRALLISFPGPISSPSLSPSSPPSPEPAPPAASAPPLLPSSPEPVPASGPDPMSRPDPARSTATRVSLVAYAFAGAFLGLGIAWTVVAHAKGNAAETLGARLNRTAGGNACAASGGGSAQGCGQLVLDFQSADTAAGYRNAWFAVAGAAAAAGITASVLSVALPSGAPERQPQVALTPGGLVLRGSF